MNEELDYTDENDCDICGHVWHGLDDYPSCRGAKAMQVYIYITGGFDYYFYERGYHRTLAGAMKAVEKAERPGTWELNGENPYTDTDTNSYWLYNGAAILRVELED